MLELRNLTRRFGDFTAVDDVSFTVEPGKLTGFVGANGAGKTTTMRMVMGLLQIHDGEVFWDGRALTGSERARFGYMPEERGLYPNQRIRDQLVYFAQLRGLSGAEARANADELLERFGLGARAKDNLEKLSLGNQQRVQIAASVIARPIALILDEPFSGLDPMAVDDMVGLLHELAATGIPVLFSSHQLDVVERICDELVILKGGRVAAVGTVDGLRDRGTIRHRLVIQGDAGWVREVEGVHVEDVSGGTVLLQVVNPGAERELLEAALQRGNVMEFARVRPSLTEVYREVSAS